MIWLLFIFVVSIAKIYQTRKGVRPQFLTPRGSSKHSSTRLFFFFQFSSRRLEIWWNTIVCVYYMALRQCFRKLQNKKTAYDTFHRNGPYGKRKTQSQCSDLPQDYFVIQKHRYMGYWPTRSRGPQTLKKLKYQANIQPSCLLGQ